MFQRQGSVPQSHPVFSNHIKVYYCLDHNLQFILLSILVVVLFHGPAVALIESAGFAGEVSENPGEVGDPGCLEADAGVVGGKTNQGLHELNRVDTGNNLWRELSHDHDNDAGQQAGLQQQGLYNFWHWEEKAIRCSPVDCCQLGGKEHEADNKDLPPHEEALDVVSPGSNLAKSEGLRMAFLVRRWVLELEFNQGDLDSLHHPDEEEDKQEDEKGGPAWYNLPETCLLLQNSVECDHS